jgi:hypothetical protein
MSLTLVIFIQSESWPDYRKMAGSRILLAALGGTLLDKASRTVQKLCRRIMGLLRERKVRCKPG